MEYWVKKEPGLERAKLDMLFAMTPEHKSKTPEAQGNKQAVRAVLSCVHQRRKLPNIKGIGTKREGQEKKKKKFITPLPNASRGPRFHHNQLLMNPLQPQPAIF